MMALYEKRTRQIIDVKPATAHALWHMQLSYIGRDFQANNDLNDGLFITQSYHI